MRRAEGAPLDVTALQVMAAVLLRAAPGASTRLLKGALPACFFESELLPALPLARRRQTGNKAP